MKNTRIGKIRDRLRVGEYEPVKVEKGVNETTLPLKEGDIFWTIRTDYEGLFDVKDQENAEIISRLVRIENLLKRKIRS